jgi:hypothetical protein
MIMNSLTTAVGLVALLAAVALLLAIVISWRLLRRFWRFSMSNPQLFGSSPAVRIITLGITALVFRSTVHQLLMAPIQLFDRLLRVGPELPRLLADLQGVDTMTTDMVIERLLFFAHSVSLEIYQSFSLVILGLPIVNGLLAFAFWVFIGTALASPPQTGNVASTDGQLRLLAAYRNLKPAGKQRIFLGVTLLVGAYLSIASIVAIPWLAQEEIPDELSGEALNTAFQGVIVTKEKIDHRYKFDDRDDATPFDRLLTVLEEVDNRADGTGAGPKTDPAEPNGDDAPRTGADATGSPPPPSQGGTPPEVVQREIEYLVQTTQDELRWKQDERAHLLARWRDLKDEAYQQQERLAEVGTSEYSTYSLTRMNRQERTTFYQALVRWHRNQNASLLQSLDSAFGYLTVRETSWEQWSSNVAAELRSAVSKLTATVDAAQREPAATFEIVDGFLDRFYRMDDDARYYERPLFRLDAGVYFPPAPPEPGQGWGPFGMVAKWLLKTRSMPLTLISGMLGFGLLGAAISSYVRGKAGAPSGQHIPDLAGVIIRGISAAIVIFLAVEGGLSLFSSGNHDLNPYVLFFTCLVGAVFSESVWDWAVDKLRDGLGRDPDDNGADDASSPPTGDPPPDPDRESP